MGEEEDREERKNWKSRESKRDGMGEEKRRGYWARRGTGERKKMNMKIYVLRR